MQTISQPATATSGKSSEQRPFALVAPTLGAALLIGTAGGFIFATVLTLTLSFGASIGPWWSALAQAHGHLQLYGWAGLFVIGVVFHFLPRLRGTPLALPRFVSWIIGFQVTGLVLRAISQTLLVATGAGIFGGLLIASGILECVALVGAALLIGITTWRGPSLVTRPAFLGVLPFFAVAFGVLAVASVVNLFNVVQAARAAGFIGGAGDGLNVTLGLFGFLVPVALAMSAQSLPMYAGLEAFPRRFLWPLAGSYFLGLLLTGIGSQLAPSSGMVEGQGMLLMGIVLLVFIGIFLHLMHKRGRLPQKVAQMAPSPEAAAHTYQRKLHAERHAYGPFVALVASAYLWAILGGVLLTADGLAMLFGAVPVFTIDAIHHSLAVGFITLLICGIAPRMLPGFSGGRIASPAFVRATLWLGNTAALLRVGTLLLAPLLVSLSVAGSSLYAIVFGLSGPLGLALAICLTINLWPALWPVTHTAPSQAMHQM
jgi:uncharacterized protein involved in response to NO